MRRDANKVLRELIYGANGDDYDLFANTELFMLAQNAEAAAIQAHLLFSLPANPKSRQIANIIDCTCAVVKPHAVQGGKAFCAEIIA